MSRRRRFVALALFAAAAMACGAPETRHVGSEILLNGALGPGYAQWLFGPIVRIATPQEVGAYLALKSDAEAERFIDEFWNRRAEVVVPGGPFGHRKLREVFDQRASEADNRFAESGVSGRRTARGTIYVLFGEPSSVTYEIGKTARAPDLEVWTYKRPAVAGLNGRVPNDTYRFAKVQEHSILVGAQPELPPSEEPPPPPR